MRCATSSLKYWTPNTRPPSPGCLPLRGDESILKLKTLKIVTNYEMIFANAGLLWLWWWPTFDFERIRKGTLQPKVLCLCVAWSRGVRARQGPVFNLLINWVLGGLTIPASHQPGGRRTAGLNAKLQTMEGSNVMKVYRRVGVDRSTAACRQFKYCNNNAKTSRSFIVTCRVK